MGLPAEDSALDKDGFWRAVVHWSVQLGIAGQCISLELEGVKQDWNGRQRPVNGPVRTANLALSLLF